MVHRVSVEKAVLLSPVTPRGESFNITNLSHDLVKIDDPRRLNCGVLLVSYPDTVVISR